MMVVNPYNFVRLRKMDEDARQTPVFHSEPSREGLFSGRLECHLYPLTPIFIPQVSTGLLIPLPDINRNGEVTPRKLKAFLNFYFTEDAEKPIIPASSLKGTIRSVAEAVSNSCLSQVADGYQTTKSFKKKGGINREFRTLLNASLIKTKPIKSYKDVQNLLASYVEKLGLQPCSQVERKVDVANSGLCPACRIFGMPGVDEGNPRPGARPNAFTGKVRFSDARMVNQLEQYEQPVLLTELSTPDATSYLYYDVIEENGNPKLMLRGRKFYYHQRGLNLDNENQGTALAYWKAYDHDSHWKPERQVPNDDGLHRKVLVRPLKPVRFPITDETGCFAFTVDFHNLTSDEFGLLLYSLSLEVKRKRASNGGWVIDDASVIHKIGYGKPAGLGSAAIVIQSIELLDPQSRYTQEVNGYQQYSKNDVMKQITSKYVEKISQTGNMRDLWYLMNWSSRALAIRYPRMNEFGYILQNGKEGYRLPKPGKEPR